jgi:hypothetical protein
VLQIQLQIVQVEGEMGKALASLERAVGTQINEQPSSPITPEAASPASVPTPPPAPGISPFKPAN